LREAIHRLELEGWVNSLPRKGIVVADIKVQDVKEVMQIRKANELLVIELITPTITKAELLTIRQQFIPTELLDEEKILPLVGGDKVHIQLAELCGNHRLLQLLCNLSSQMQWFAYWALQISGRAQEVLHEHTLILDAIQEKNIKKAQDCATKHLESTEAALLQGLQLREHLAK
jgi:DNA-binding GntR family transcriptional regulator